MEEKKLNKNAQRSRKLIKQGFVNLLKQKSDTSSITITDIVNAAGVNRATFYAHYSCIKDLTDEIEQEVIDKLMELLKQFHFDNFSQHPTPLLLQVSIFLSENEDYYRTLINAPEAGKFIDHLMDIFIQYLKNDESIPKEVRESKPFLLRACYFAGGLSSMYVEWFKGKLDCTLYDIPAEIGLLFKDLDMSNIKDRAMIAGKS